MPGYYDMSEDERVALTQSAIAERRTLYERWTALATPESEPWSHRAALAAEWLSAEESVADMGCGTMILERYLRPDAQYHPVDAVARDARTIVCDFNISPPVLTGATAAACLGLLEYVIDVPRFLAQLVNAYPICVASYNPTHADETERMRRSHGWVNDYDRAGIEQIFTHAGWRVEAQLPVGKIELLWRLRRT